MKDPIIIIIPSLLMETRGQSEKNIHPLARFPRPLLSLDQSSEG